MHYERKYLRDCEYSPLALPNLIARVDGQTMFKYANPWEKTSCIVNYSEKAELAFSLMTGEFGDDIPKEFEKFELTTTKQDDNLIDLDGVDWERNDELVGLDSLD